jgi:hypothetical protein
MFARMMWAAGILALLCGVAEAQDGLRSAALPEPTLSSAVADERDLFRVPPDFYNRRPDFDGSQLFFSEFLPTFVTTPYYWYAPQYPHIPPPVQLDARVDARRNTQREAIAESPVLPSAPPTPISPGKPKTFYVIPGCYAGDRPPALEWLPRGCDTSKMRIVTPTPVPLSLLQKGV